jgi:hypothetical protein
LIVYVDANNLYGKALSFPLPVGDFAWLQPDEITLQEILDAASLEESSAIGYFVEVDLAIPDCEHNNMNDYPFAPERVKMSALALSPTQAKIQREYDMSRNNNYHKLLGTLLPKQCYLLHFLNLKFYLENDVKHVCIRRVIRFRPQAFINKFIDKNTQLRALATSTE